MKKILLSCVTCLLAVGLLAGCDDEVEEVNPEDPNAGVVEPSGDDSGTGGGTVSGDDGSGTEKEPEPELAPQFLEVDELVDGESYYLGFPYTAAYTTDWYLFNGTTDSYGYYLQCSVVGTEGFEPVLVTVSITEADPEVPDSVETIGLTFDLDVDGTKTNYTIYAWPGANQARTWQYGEITTIETSLLEDETDGPKTDAVTEFTWDAERGTLAVTLTNGDWYFSTYQGESSISLSATSTNYACSHFYVANPDYVGPEYVAPNIASDETYKLGCFDVDNYTYRYFNGATVNSYLNTTAEWSEGADVFITDQPKDGIENSCTLSFINASGELKYIANNDATTFTFSDDPCVWVWDEENEVFAQADCGRAMFFYESASHDYTIRAYYRTDTYLAYPHVIAYSENPGVAVRPAVTSVAITTAAGETSGTVEEGKTLQLSAAIEPEHASTEVTWTSSDETKATVSEAGLVTGVAATEGEEVVTITATSTYTTGISGSINITVIAPQEDPDNLIGTFDFSNAQFAAKSNTNAISSNETLLTDLKLAYTGSDSELSSAVYSGSVYCGGSSGSELQNSAECLKLGKGSSTAGSVSITFSDESINIAKVVVVWCPYSAANLGLVVNGETQTYATTAGSYTTWDAVTETVYESITETGNVLSLASAKGSTTGNNYGALIHSIKLYSAEA